MKIKAIAFDLKKIKNLHMKNLFIFFLLLIVTACSRSENIVEDTPDKPTPTETPGTIDNISGEWRLVKVETFNGHIDFSNENIIYNFQQNDVLKVNGAINPSLQNGEYNYEYKIDYLNASPTSTDPKIPIVKISNLIYAVVYYPTSGTLVLDRSYVDSGTYFLKRK